MIEKSSKHDVIHNLTWSNFPLLKVKWEDKELCLGFDSGHTESLLGAKMIEQLKNLESTIDTSVGLGGSLEEDVYLLKNFSFMLGNTSVALNNLTVLKRDIFGQGCSEMMGLLGADIVQNRNWILDFPNGYFEIR